MNVNGSTFHLFLGRDDWGRCSVPGHAGTLAEQWTPEATAFDAGLPDYVGDAILLPATVDPIPLTPGERAYTLADHRDATSDRFGNLYRVGDGRDRLIVMSVGDGRENAFWPADPPSGWRASPAFSDTAPRTVEQLLRAVTVTHDDHLLAAGRLDGREMLWRFDLIGGGDPDAMALPSGIRGEALAPTTDGGFWLLDGDGVRLLRYDRDMRLATEAEAGGDQSFSPTGTAPLPRTRRVPVAISCVIATRPCALAVLPDGTLLVLDATTASSATLFILDPGAAALRLLIALDHGAVGFALTHDAEHGQSAYVALPGGNEARRIALFTALDQWDARAETDTIPLRRFGGRALVASKGRILYDSGETPLWVPLVALRHRRLMSSISFVTPPLDGREPQCIWDRVRLDACIPPGASIRIEARTAEDALLLDPASTNGWIAQPVPIMLATGFEIPGKRPVAAAANDPAHASGTWELLLQGLTGRYAQFRITLTGTGRNTPRLRAMRAWFPRFSYAQRFLPAIYREDGGDFLDRFLTSFEGIYTGIEDRIATAETLFDPRIAPVEALDWLAGWFDTALDPAWDEERRRLFIAHAPAFFAWRGTRKGMLLALRLALGKDVTAADLDLSTPHPDCPGDIRIVEAHMTRTHAIVPPPPPIANADQGLASGSLSDRWRPEEGSAALWARWIAEGYALPASMSNGSPFPLAAPGDLAAEWASFSRSQFGFLPDAGAAQRDGWQGYQRSQGVATTALLPLPSGEDGASVPEMWSDYAAIPDAGRAQWQGFLTRRYRTVERLNAAHGSFWPSLSFVAAPDRLPGSPTAIRDWLAFEGQWLPMQRNAHRFSVLLPRIRVDVDPGEEEAQLALAQRIVALEKPAHTLFDTRFYWAMNRIGEARLGQDTGIGEGSRAPELIPDAILGRAYIGATFIGGPADPGKSRSILAC